MNIVLDFIVGVFVIIYYMLESWVLFFVPRRWRFKSITGQVALVTGGGSGMGRLLCLELARRGCRVITWDVNEEGNAETVRQVKGLLKERACHQKPAPSSPKQNGEQWRPVANVSPDDSVFGYKVDLCNREEVYRVAEIVKKQVGTVDILINNAGVVSGKSFLATSDQQNLLTMNVNALCHFWTVKAFLPGMLDQNRGHIVSLASLAGLTGVNKLVDYCASKFAAVGFDEALRNELKANGSDVRTTCVCPYYVATGMFEGVRSRVLPILKPEYVVQEIIAAILTNQEVLVLPRIGNFLVFLKSFLPVKCLQTAEKFMGVAETMSGFKGRAISGSAAGSGKKSD